MRWILLSLFVGLACSKSMQKKHKSANKLLASSPVVVSSGVTYQGTTNAQSQTYFRGIRYATAPTGKLRFAPPQAVIIPTGTHYNATAYGPQCHQFTDQQNGQSEDCLFVDIQVPAGHKATDSIPVMLWIYGAGFTNRQVVQDPSALLAQSTAMGSPIMYVAVNYRVGAYGFLGGSQAQSAGYTNIGILDQRMALQWVQQHIADFGGDPSRVTLVGQSAGAVSTSIHLLRDGGDTHGLYRAAIMASGTANTVGIGNAQYRQKYFTNLVKHCGCTGKSDAFGCMRAVDEVHFHRAMYSTTKGQQYAWAPQIDGSTVPASPASLFASGKFANIPILNGDVLDEGTSKFEPTINTTSALTAYLSTMLPKVSASTLTSLAGLYSSAPADGSPYNTGSNTFNLGSLGKQAASMYGDIFFHANRRAFMTAAAARGQSVFGYLFTEGAGKSGSMGVLHGGDLPYWFGRSKSNKLSQQMMSYWINFVNTMNPNGQSLPNWPTYSASGNLLQLASNATGPVQDNYRQQQMSYSKLD